MKNIITFFVIVGGFLWPQYSVLAADDMSMGQEKELKQIYGWELMSPKERVEHRTKMRGFKSEEARTAYRIEHHEQMRARAREKGLVLPDEPLLQGRGKGSGAMR